MSNIGSLTSSMMSPLMCQTLAELQMRNGTIACSFEWRNHPECEKLKEFTAKWMWNHFGGDIINISYDKLIGSNFHLLASMTMAGGQSDRMPVAVKFTVWLFVFDNLMDEPRHMGADIGASQEIVHAIMSVFHISGDDEDDDNNNNMVVHSSRIIKNGDNDAGMKGGNNDYGGTIGVIRESARDWWEEMLRLGMSARQQYRFVSVFKQYLNANTEQVAFRQRCRIPDLDTYKELRLHSSAWFACSVVLEFTLGLDLPEDMMEHPLLFALKVAAASHVMFVNDIFSFRKELSDGDLMNLVPVLLWHNLGQQHGVEPLALVQQTVSQALGLVRELDEECMRLMAKIQVMIRCGGVLAEEAAAVERYMEGVSGWLSGSLRWHRISKRYMSTTTTTTHLPYP